MQNGQSADGRTETHRMVKILAGTLPEIGPFRARQGRRDPHACDARFAGGCWRAGTRLSSTRVTAPARPRSVSGRKASRGKGVPFRRRVQGPSWGRYGASWRVWFGQNSKTHSAGDLDAPEGLVGALRRQDSHPLLVSLGRPKGRNGADVGPPGAGGRKMHGLGRDFLANGWLLGAMNFWGIRLAHDWFSIK